MVYKASKYLQNTVRGGAVNAAPVSFCVWWEPPALLVYPGGCDGHSGPVITHRWCLMMMIIAVLGRAQSLRVI